MLATLLSLTALAQDTSPPRCSGRPTTWTDATADTRAQKPDAIAALEAWAFPERTPEQDSARQGVRTEGLLVIQGDKILYERYARGFTAEKPHLTWSASKTYTNALTAIAVRDGLLDLDDSICDHVEATNPDNCVVTVEDLLSFGSGIEWRETYENSPLTSSSVVSMLYGDGVDDMAAFISGAGRRAAPGTVWQYSSGDTTLLAAVLAAAMAPTYGDAFPWTALFDPLGIDGVVWERDGAGTYVGSSYLYSTPRDMARFGQLWRDDGCWGETPILPEGWVAQSTAISAPIQQGALDRTSGTQGWQVWLNQPVTALGDTAPPWGDAPTDAFAAQGHWKQRIAVLPSHDMIVVRVGDDRDGSFRNADLFARVVPLGEPTGIQPPPLPPPSAATGTLAASEPLRFDAGLLRLGASYGAKLACSCMFVMQQDEDYCRAWVRASPDITKIKFNTDDRSVRARALVVSAEARWIDERHGCTLE